jgi:hypothetical protein
MNVIAGLQETNDRQSSHIRFHCDDDMSDRFQLVPDMNIPGTIPNSQRSNLQEWDDIVNGMRHLGRNRACRRNDPGTRRYWAYTTPQQSLLRGARWSNQQPHRSVITVST